MFSLYTFLFPWGQILQVLALVHYFKRRPDGYWVWVIFMGGGLGAIAYCIVEVLPDLGLLQGEFKFFARRRRINELEAMVQVNPSSGNFEELGDLLHDNKKFQAAKSAFDKAITPRTTSPDPYYRRAQCLMELGDYSAAVPDLEFVLRAERKYDFFRAGGLLAHCYAKLGRTREAEQLFQEVSQTSTLSETQYNYACFLLEQGHNRDAYELANQILLKKTALPNYLKRRERPWFRKAKSLMSRARKAAAASATA